VGTRPGGAADGPLTLQRGWREPPEPGPWRPDLFPHAGARLVLGLGREHAQAEAKSQGLQAIEEALLRRASWRPARVGAGGEAGRDGNER